MSDINEINEGMRWYVAHTYSGYENKVKANLEKIIENRNLGSLIEEIFIPTEIVVESSGDGEKEIETNLFPSYVLIKMVMSDETWHVVRNVRGVTGFVGPGSKPVPLTDEEVSKIIKKPATVTPGDLVEIGDTVDIIDGIFKDYTGKLAEISPDKSEVTVIISTVGRDMPIKLDMKLIRKSEEK